MELLERFYVYANNFFTYLCAIQWSCFYGPLCLGFKEGVEKWIKVHFIEFRRVGQAWATFFLRTLFSSFVRFGDKTHQTLDSACKKPIFHNCYCAAQTSNHQVTQKSHMAEALVCWQFACKWPAVIEIDLLLVLKCFEGIQLHVHCERPAPMVSKQCLPMALCVGSLFAEFWIANCRLDRVWKTASPVQLCPCHSYISHILKFHDFIFAPRRWLQWKGRCLGSHHTDRSVKLVKLVKLSTVWTTTRAVNYF